MNAYCLIPASSFPKGAPISASVALPAGTVEVQWWVVVAERMAERTAWLGTAEVRFRQDGGDFTDSDMTSVTMRGAPGLVPGGIEGGRPGELPSSSVMFGFDARDSGGGGTSPPPLASHVRVTMLPREGNNGGAIWCGAVVAAFDNDGNAIPFDPATRGS